MSRSIRTRLAKLEKNSPTRGSNWEVVIYPQDQADADRLKLAAYEQLLARGYQPDRHQLRLYEQPDNGRPHPGRPTPPIRITRHP